MFADAAVLYDGRAYSTLERGNYVIMVKPDQSIAIHGAQFASKPLNYQNADSTIITYRRGTEFTDLWRSYFTEKPKFLIWSVNKGEILAIAVYKVHSDTILNDWSTNKIKLSKSEREFVELALDDLYNLFPNINMVVAEMEVSNPYGVIDIMMADDCNELHIVEAKRKIMSVSGCGQLSRYARYYRDIGCAVHEYLLAPTISKNAVEYSTEYGQHWVPFNPWPPGGVSDR